MILSVAKFLELATQAWPKLSVELVIKREEKIVESVGAFGLPGSKIEGSYQERWYCTVCGQPMRVPHVPDLPRPCDEWSVHFPTPYHVCEECGGTHGVPGIGNSQAFPIDDITGYQANAIRDLEQS